MNNDIGISRRAVMLGSALLPALGMASAQTSKTIVISSANGERACARAMEVLKAGGDTLDAVVAGVNTPATKRTVSPFTNSVVCIVLVFGYRYTSLTQMIAIIIRICQN